MKKIISLMTCIVLFALTLVGCTDPGIGDHYDEFGEIPKDVGRVTLNMYIIGAEDSDNNTLVTVKRMITQHTETKYNTTLNVHYFSYEEYEQKLKEGVESGAADIVLINSQKLFDDVKDKLTDLTSILKLKRFGNLLKTIPGSLWDATKLNDKSYIVPNNRIVGEYKYLVIDRACAERYFNYSFATLSTYTSIEDCQGLIEKIMADDNYKDNVDELVKVVSGDYADKALYEADDKVCNVVEYPNITRAEALEAGFAVTTSCKYPERAMDIINAINLDVTLRNRLQYGYENSNYELVDGYAIKDTDPSNKYEMNILYTGNIFTAYYSEQYGWTPEVCASGTNQNKESYFKAD